MEEIKYTEEQCSLINDILENNFVISKKSKKPILNELMSRLEIDEEEATRIYDASVKVIKEEVKDKLKHPFQSQD